jgi:acyl carrier protein
MERDAIFREVVDALRTTGAPVEARLDDTPFAAYGLESLRLARLAVTLEERLEVEIPDREAFAVTSFASLVDLLERRLGAPSAPT